MTSVENLKSTYIAFRVSLRDKLDFRDACARNHVEMSEELLRFLKRYNKGDGF